MRTAAKRDAHEPSIIRALRAAGIDVCQISQAGIPDLLTSRRRTIKLLEVKKRPGLLTAAQRRYRGPRTEVYTVDDALRAWRVPGRIRAMILRKIAKYEEEWR